MLTRTFPIPNMDGALTLLVFSLLLCILRSSALPFPSPNGIAGSNRTTADELALLSFKSMLSEGSLLSWSASGSYCSWPGVICGRQHPERVVALRLPSHKLSGSLSPSLGNLSFLQELNLGNNQLVGQIPPELGRLLRLRLLNLSENSLQGSIPVTLRRCTSLMKLELGSNQLQDFGLAKILNETRSYYQQSVSSMGFRGTIGYAPPEYGAGNMASTFGDIYSYGILVLETVTGKRPTDSKFIEGLSIRQYVELGLGGRVMDVVDTKLSFSLENEFRTADDRSYKLKIDCLISLLRLGLSCSQEMPSSRMATGGILKELHAMKESLLL